MSDAPREVLLVEDDPDDVELMRGAVAAGKGRMSLKAVGDGEAALAYLRGGGAPALILLDLNLPSMSGLEVLAELKRDARLRAIPVLVLTTSGSERDAREAYAAGACCFLTKPTGLDALRALASHIEELWFGFGLPLPPPRIGESPNHSP